MWSASSAGVAFSISSVLAPTRSGKTTSPPRPKVNASGGVPVKTSSALGFTTWPRRCRRSRARRDGSASSPWAPGRAGREREQGDVVGRGRDVVEARRLVRDQCAVRSSVRRRRSNGRHSRDRAAARSARKRWSHSARSIRAISWMSRSSPRAQHRHGGHGDRARLEHTEPARDQPRVVRPAQQHPVARARPSSVVSRCAIRLAVREQPVVAPRRLPGARRQARSPPCSAMDRLVEQRGRAVESIGVGARVDRAASRATRSRVAGASGRRRRRARMSCRPSPSFLAEAQLYDVLLTTVNVSICSVGSLDPRLRCVGKRGQARGQPGPRCHRG